MELVYVFIAVFIGIPAFFFCVGHWVVFILNTLHKYNFLPKVKDKI